MIQTRFFFVLLLLLVGGRKGHGAVPESKPILCQEESQDVPIPHVLQDLASIPLSIIHISQDAVNVSLHAPFPSPMWSLPPGLHIFVGLNQTGALSASLHHRLATILASELPVPSDLSRYAHVPTSLLPALSPLVLPVEGLGELLWHHNASQVFEEMPLLVNTGRKTCMDQSSSFIDKGGGGSTKPIIDLGPSTGEGEGTPPPCLVAYGLSLEQASTSRGLARVHLLSCRATSCPPIFPQTHLQEEEGEQEKRNVASLIISAKDPPGLHRQMDLSLTLPPSLFFQGSPRGEVGRLLFLYHIPEGAYVDVNELEQRHNFGLPGASSMLDRPRPSVQVYGRIDVERPASHSIQHAVGLIYPVPPPSSSTDADKMYHLETSFPIHVRYPRPTMNRTHPYSYITFPRPLIFRENEDIEWESILVTSNTQALQLRVPAGEIWLRDVVVWVTMVAETLGAFILIVVVWVKMPSLPSSSAAAKGGGREEESKKEEEEREDGASARKGKAKGRSKAKGKAKKAASMKEKEEADQQEEKDDAAGGGGGGRDEGTKAGAATAATTNAAAATITSLRKRPTRKRSLSSPPPVTTTTSTATAKKKTVKRGGAGRVRGGSRRDVADDEKSERGGEGEGRRMITRSAASGSSSSRTSGRSTKR